MLPAQSFNNIDIIKAMILLEQYIQINIHLSYDENHHDTKKRIEQRGSLAIHKEDIVNNCVNLCSDRLNKITC